jgi:hypothetical protein
MEEVGNSRLGSFARVLWSSNDHITQTVSVDIPGCAQRAPKEIGRALGGDEGMGVFKARQICGPEHYMYLSAVRAAGISYE